jgi:hypothetical protein
VSSESAATPSSSQFNPISISGFSNDMEDFWESLDNEEELFHFNDSPQAHNFVQTSSFANSNQNDDDSECEDQAFHITPAKHYGFYPTLVAEKSYETVADSDGESDWQLATNYNTLERSRTTRGQIGVHVDCLYDTPPMIRRTTHSEYRR